MRFLITGARGLLGAEWVRALTPAYEVVATDRPEVDLTDRAASSACVAEAVPDLILHGAAYTTVDQAEAEPERRYAANVLATGHVLITPPLLYPNSGAHYQVAWWDFPSCSREVRAAVSSEG